MTLEEKKKKMLEYTDFFGGDLICEDEIKEATSDRELYEIIENHKSFLESMLQDANRHLDKFKDELGL